MITSITIDETIDTQYEPSYCEIDCDEYRYEFENIDIISKSKIKCISCHNYTTYPSRIDQYDSKLFHYECRTCAGIYAVCVGCENITNETVHLAKLISHHNSEEVEEDGENYKVTTFNFDNLREEEKTNFTQYKDELDIYENSEIVYTQPTYFYDEDKFGPITGPDGGFQSTWKCKCSTFIVTDK
jgi:hypothetical protein